MRSIPWPRQVHVPLPLAEGREGRRLPALGCLVTGVGRAQVAATVEACWQALSLVSEPAVPVQLPGVMPSLTCIYEWLQRQSPAANAPGQRRLQGAMAGSR